MKGVYNTYDGRYLGVINEEDGWMIRGSKSWE